MTTDNEKATDSDVDAQEFFSPLQASALLHAVWDETAGTDHTQAFRLIDAHERFLRNLWLHTTTSLILDACDGDVGLVGRWVGLVVGLDDILTLARAGIAPEQLSRTVPVHGEEHPLMQHIGDLLGVLPDKARMRAIFANASPPPSPHHYCGGHWSDERRNGKGVGWECDKCGVFVHRIPPALEGDA